MPTVYTIFWGLSRCRMRPEISERSVERAKRSSTEASTNSRTTLRLVLHSVFFYSAIVRSILRVFYLTIIRSILQERIHLLTNLRNHI